MYELVLNNTKRKNLKYLRRNCPNVTWSTKNPTWTGLGLNNHLCGKRLQYSQLSDGMNVDLLGMSIMNINSNVIQYCNSLPVITVPSLISQNVAVEYIESKMFTALLQ